MFNFLVHTMKYQENNAETSSKFLKYLYASNYRKIILDVEN